MKLPRPLATADLELRCLAPAECERSPYLGWLQEPEIVRYLEVRLAPPRTWQELAQYVADCNSSEDTLLLGLFLKNGATHIGNIKLGPVNPYHRQADIGLLIGEREHWGKGLAAQAIEALAEYAFTRLDIMKLTAGCYAANAASARAFEKAGFVEEGRLKSHWKTETGRDDGILLGRVRTR
jgi:ribosomal-protein-alanine N-acetyltransferase